MTMAESVTLAHPARAVTLAQSLDPARYEVHLVCDPRYLALFGEWGFLIHPIRSIESRVFQDRLANGDALYTTADLRQYVEEDLRVLNELKPDMVVGDFRLSLSVSARLAGKQYNPRCPAVGHFIDAFDVPVFPQAQRLRQLDRFRTIQTQTVGRDNR